MWISAVIGLTPSNKQVIPLTDRDGRHWIFLRKLRWNRSNKLKCVGFILTGTYIPHSNRSKVNQHEASATCPLCQLEDEDTLHCLINGFTLTTITGSLWLHELVHSDYIYRFTLTTITGLLWLQLQVHSDYIYRFILTTITGSLWLQLQVHSDYNSMFTLTL
jgi:hypothetical protein